MSIKIFASPSSQISQRRKAVIRPLLKNVSTLIFKCCAVIGSIIGVIKDTPETRKLASDRITLIADELLKVRAFLDAKMEESCDSDIS